MPHPVLVLLPLTLGCAPRGLAEPRGDSGDAAWAPDAEQVDADVERGGGAACAELSDPLSAGRFATWDRGWVWEESQPAGQQGDDGGWGVAVDDFNGDGLLDIFLPHWGASQLFLANQSGALFDASAGLPQGADGPLAYDTLSVVAGDLDGDGDVDLVLGNEGDNAVWLNDGDAGFVAVERPFGAAPGKQSHSLSLGDFDGDGVLDLLGASGFAALGDLDSPDDFPPERTELFFGDGDGTFTDMDALLPDVEPVPSNMAGFVDANGDGHLDIYVTPDKVGEGRRSVLYLGDGEGGLTLWDDPGGLDLAIDGMGLAEGDLNGDGVADYAISGWNELAVLVSAGDGWWAESSRPLGVEVDDQRVVGWGMEFADVDNDLDLDLLAAFGPDYDHTGAIGGGDGANPPAQRWGYFRNDGGVFDEVSAERGLFRAGNRRGFVVADLNADGHLDLVARDLADHAALYQGACTERSWLTIAVEQRSDPNVRGIGARLDIETARGPLVRWIRAGSTSVASSAPPIAHVGLDDLAGVERIVVTWPDGTYSAVGPVQQGRHVTIVRP